MKPFILTFIFGLCFSSVEVCAQTQEGSVPIEANLSICNQEVFEQAERFFDLRQLSSDRLARAERALKEVVINCPDYGWRYQAEEYLRIVHEESAEHIFVVASYYWNSFLTGHGGLLGAYSRFRTITEKYPDYSKIGLVDQLLEEVNKARKE
jgi:outer membrane protein assembly factor BamD (BamD/ComL family)